MKGGEYFQNIFKPKSLELTKFKAEMAPPEITTKKEYFGAFIRK